MDTTDKTQSRAEHESPIASLRRLGDGCRPLRVALDLAEPGQEIPQAVEVLAQHAKALRRLLRMPALPMQPPLRPCVRNVRLLALEVTQLERQAEDVYRAA